ncbi:conjugal transfer protein TraD [Phenylobacterium soli]|uniref:Conjugal transfer protein TraC n=1 Tax=Phenylobacterium soli TaxID=2170551 RepID=A0A328AHF2_9CAUL|nr:conjugal transfer protein TraD [Phenylobacterium soli]RAK54089.1 conjugal transfer protein TraC [Phenylobacterium soli]
MRKPRNIDAELRALADKAKGLKARKITQLGELVVATGADNLDADTLAGALLSALEEHDADAKEAWRRKGAAFFQHARRSGAPRNRTPEHAPRAS